MKVKKLTTSFFVLFLLVASLSMNSVKADEAVPDSPEKVSPLKVGDKAPDVTLMTEEGEAFDLNAALAKQPTVLIFYRGRW